MASNNEHVVPVNGTSKHENGDDYQEVSERALNLLINGSPERNQI